MPQVHSVLLNVFVIPMTAGLGILGLFVIVKEALTGPKCYSIVHKRL